MGVAAVGGEQFVVGSDLGDATVLDEGDPVGAADRREAMGDDQGSAVTHRRVERRLDQRLVLVVEMAGGFVEHHDARVLQQQPCDRQPLLLAAAEPVAALTDDRVVAVGERSDRVVDPSGLRRVDELLVGGLGIGVTQVVADRLVEQVRVL